MFEIFRKPLVVKRKDSAPTLNSSTGRYTESSESTISITASVQPLSRTDLEVLPEGKRQERAFKIYTDTQLFSADTATKKSGDLVVYEGIDYEVYSPLPWRNNIINHYKYLIIKVKE